MNSSTLGNELINIFGNASIGTAVIESVKRASAAAVLIAAERASLKRASVAAA